MSPAPAKPLSRMQTIILPWVVCLLAAIFYAYDFFLRIAPSVMIHPLMHSLQINATMIGFISATYYGAYTPLQIPSGLLIDKFNVQFILLGSIILCIVGAIIFAAFPTLPTILLGRFLMGAGSAFAFTGTLKLAARWIPKKHYALFVGVTAALGTLGAVTADWTLSRLVALFGWRQAMLITAYAGAGIAILILLIVRDTPPWLKGHPRPKPSWRKSFTQLRIILKTPGFWFNGIVGAIMFIPINVLASLWGVAFLIQGKHFAPTTAASVTSLIFIGTALGSPLSGWLSDLIKSRKLPLLIGTLCLFLLTFILIYINIQTPWVIDVALFLLGFFVGSQALVFTIAREISPPYTTGAATAATNFLVTAGALIFQPLIGYLLDLNWNKKIGTHGMHLYNLHDFKVAFALLPLLMIVCFILILFIPTTLKKKNYRRN